jgi:hypothetical protein
MSKLERWLTLVANLSVVAGIVFLAAEIRQNTETTRSASYDRTMEALNDWRLTLASDSALSAMYDNYARNTELGDSLPEGDFRLQLLLNTLFGVLENAYYMNERGFLGEAEWGRFERSICSEHRRAVRSGRWDGTPSMRALLTDQFASYVAESCPS